MKSLTEIVNNEPNGASALIDGPSGAGTTLWIDGEGLYLGHFISSATGREILDNPYAYIASGGTISGSNLLISQNITAKNIKATTSISSTAFMKAGTITANDSLSVAGSFNVDVDSNITTDGNIDILESKIGRAQV